MQGKSWFEAMLESEEVFVDPTGKLLDGVLLGTKVTIIYRHDILQVRARYPGAQIVEWEAYRAWSAAKQKQAVQWIKIADAEIDEAFEVLPPACRTGVGFLIGEPTDHAIDSGEPRFSAYVWNFNWTGEDVGPFISDRPLTVAEMQGVTRESVLASVQS